MIFSIPALSQLNPHYCTHGFSQKYSLPHIHLHAFRHTAVSGLLANGTDIVVSKQLCHAGIITMESLCSRIIEGNQAKAVGFLTDTQKELFSRYSDCVREHQTMAECMLFQNCFFLGAKVMLEIMTK
jgi:hypothetical protein